MRMYKNNDKEIEDRINSELKNYGVAYKIKDSEGNQFCYGGIENGCPWYRGMGGSKHIDNMLGYKIVEQYCKLV